MTQEHLIVPGASPVFRNWVRRVGKAGDPTLLEHHIDVAHEQLITNDAAIKTSPIMVTHFISGAISAAADQFAFVVPNGFEGYALEGARIYALTAPTDADLIADVSLDGTTMYTTQANRPTITATENDSGDRVAPDVTAITVGGIITVDIDQVGSTIAGSNLTITLVFSQAV